MAFTGSYMCSSFKKELLTATHDFTLTTGDVFKIALYNNSASFTAATTAYTATDEITGTNYTAGGATLTNVTPTNDGTTGITDFADVTWTTATISGVRGAMIYNSTKANRAVAILDFGSNKAVTAANFTVYMPSPTAALAIVKVA